MEFTLRIPRRRNVINIDASKLSLLPGDVLVVNWPANVPLHPSDVYRTAGALREQFPDNKVLVLANGLTVDSIFGSPDRPDLGVADPFINDQGENDAQ